MYQTPFFFIFLQRNNKTDSVAQLVEQQTLNLWVVGSNPTGVTIKHNHLNNK